MWHKRLTTTTEPRRACDVNRQSGTSKRQPVLAPVAGLVVSYAEIENVTHKHEEQESNKRKHPNKSPNHLVEKLLNPVRYGGAPNKTTEREQKNGQYHLK
jgi:hypothetical protein